MSENKVKGLKVGDKIVIKYPHAILYGTVTFVGRKYIHYHPKNLVQHDQRALMKDVEKIEWL